MSTKRCRQCGEIKPIDSFRGYYSGSSGTYTICKACEKINSRAKYLRRKGAGATEADKAELQQINELYELQRKCGLKPPQQRSNDTQVSNLLDMYTKKIEAMSEVPEELQEWLTHELTAAPEHYFDDVYEYLRKKYMPLIRIDNDMMLPVYDETHKDTLNKILDRFNAYEDIYYRED